LPEIEAHLASLSLSPEDVDYLRRNTSYNEMEIREWYRGFKRDCPNGQMSRAKVERLYSMVMSASDAPVFVDQIFAIFDRDGNGSIDFREFMMATDTTEKGSIEDKVTTSVKI